jgi:ATP-dependent DNA helicase RecG
MPYHKNYAEEKPIEIQVLVDRIEILSYPGPLPPISNVDLQQRQVIARDYRNRRIGDFLKELNLTEGKATSFPIIRGEMAKNGSPAPVFYTDDERTLFLVTLPCHPEFVGKGTKSLTKSLTKSVTKLTDEEVDVYFENDADFQLLSNVLNYDISNVREYVRDLIVSKSLMIIDYLKEEKSRMEILTHLGLINHSKHFNYYIKPLIDFGMIEMTLPDKPNSRFQKYRLTDKGKKLLKQSL